MEDEFVPYDIALAMKDLGYDKNCMAYFFKNGKLNKYWNKEYRNSGFGHGLPFSFSCSAPTWRQAFKWFKDEHKMKFHIKEDNWNHWCAPLILIPETNDFEELCDWFETYEEAELACLRKLIEIVKEDL